MRIALGSVVIAGLTVLSGGAQTPAPRPSDPAREKRLEWFRDAKYGMFIHWGLYAIPAGEWKGQRSLGLGEWIMNRSMVPVAEYEQLATQFNPVKFNPDEWVQLAQDAGMKYIVITSKHHDGFAMFKSAASPYNVVDATPFRRDVIAEMAEACRRHGMKLVLYYSQAQDWHHPGGAPMGGHWDRAQDGNMDEYIDRIAVPQVREILSKYGPISILWWDTPLGMNAARAARFLPLLNLQPGLITNNRLGGGVDGDLTTPEQFIPATGIPGKDFEVCMTMNDTWGYKSYDNNWKSGEELVRNLIDSASKGGNFLLNVGPTSEGLIPQPSVDRLKGIGRWMQVNKDAIYGTTAGPFAYLRWGRAARRGSMLYLYVFDWPKSGVLRVPLKNKVKAAY